MRTLLQDERGEVNLWVVFLIIAGVVALLGIGVVVALVASTLILTPIALFVIIWRRIFPFARGIAEWTANRVNLIPFFLFMNLIILPTSTLLIIWFVLYWQTGSIVFLLLALPLIPVLGLALLIFGIPMGLAIIVFTMRLNHHLFDRFRTRFLTFAFNMVMRIAKRKQERAERPQKRAKMRLRRGKRQQPKVENPQKKAENPQSRTKRLQNKEDKPQKRAENPQSRPKKRRWRAKSRQ